MLDFFENLFNTDGFPARWNCGVWSDSLGWLHIISDLAIFGAYTAIPCVLTFFILRRHDIPFPASLLALRAPSFSLAASVICIEAIISWEPVYRLAGVQSSSSRRAVSWGTVVRSRADNVPRRAPLARPG